MQTMSYLPRVEIILDSPMAISYYVLFFYTSEKAWYKKSLPRMVSFTYEIDLISIFGELSFLYWLVYFLYSTLTKKLECLFSFYSFSEFPQTLLLNSPQIEPFPAVFFPPLLYLLFISGLLSTMKFTSEWIYPLLRMDHPWLVDFSTNK